MARKSRTNFAKKIQNEANPRGAYWPNKHKDWSREGMFKRRDRVSMIEIQQESGEGY